MANLGSRTKTPPRSRRNAVQRKPAAPQTRRGRATREKLKGALVDLLQENTYYEIRLEDITERAGVRVSLFYHYFQSKVDITHEVLTDLLSTFKLDVADRPRGISQIAAIHHANRKMVELYALNPGAMRCLLETQDGSTPFSMTWRALTLDWNRRIATSIARQFPGAFAHDDEYLAVAYALSGTVDNFLFEYYVQANPGLRRACPSDEHVASFLTTLWCRMLYLENPDEHLQSTLTGFARLGRRIGT